MSFIQSNWLLILVMIVSGAMLVWPLVQNQFSPSKVIGNLELTRLINSANALLVDLRETRDYEGGRLPKAVHIPLSQLESRGSELARHVGRPIVTYVMRGDRGRMAGNVLARLGFKDIYTLNGGYLAWKDAGLPVEK